MPKNMFGIRYNSSRDLESRERDLFTAVSAGTKIILESI